MLKFRTLALAGLAPIALSACQSAQQGVSTFSGDQLTSKPVSSTEDVLRPASEEKTAKAAEQAKSKKKAKADKPKKKRKKSSFAQRKAKYRPIIAKYAKKHGVPLRLAMAVVEVESSFRANATGRVGEIGLMQLLPRTARYIGVKGDLNQLYDPDTNIRWGMKYLAGAYHKAGGKTCRTILKYNAGHQATRMNPMSRDYCNRVAKILARG